MRKDKDFVDYVIKTIKKDHNIDLPDFGIIAGQSIAELYFRFHNIPIKTRIKDIDLFFRFKRNEKSKEKNEKIKIIMKEQHLLLVYLIIFLLI
tara:strand:+ start:9117 stop:9395 length:279 start_codon:yes stop_codon:yes gene_type:complete